MKNKQLMPKLLLAGGLLLSCASNSFAAPTDQSKATTNTPVTSQPLAANSTKTEGKAQKASAKTLDYTVYLLTMKGSQVTDRGSDALFMHIVQYLSSGEATTQRIPANKATWQLANLKDINKLKLTEFHLAPQDAITTVFSLLEEDQKPWATTDLIGSIRLRIRNDDGELAYQWSLPNRTDGPEVIETKYGNARRFSLYSDDGKYVLYFMLLPTEPTHHVVDGVL